MKEKVFICFSKKYCALAQLLYKSLSNFYSKTEGETP